jgi:hypothetical protein
VAQEWQSGAAVKCAAALQCTRLQGLPAGLTTRFLSFTGKGPIKIVNSTPHRHSGVCCSDASVIMCPYLPS